MRQVICTAVFLKKISENSTCQKKKKALVYANVVKT